MVIPRPVVVGPVINGKRVIREGLTENDKVIVNGLSKAFPGAPVTPITEEEAAKTATTAAAQPQ